MEQVIELINPILRGWVNYFAVGDSSRCFSFVKDWVEKKIRRHLMRARKRKGFGWKRWSKRWLYEDSGCSTATECNEMSHCRKSFRHDRPHNP